MSQLNKEFSERDVNRIRNLVKNKAGEKTTVSSGYSKKEVDRKEGDVWEEDGKKWTIKNGVKQTVSKMQELKAIANFPVFCPKCKHVMNSPYDRQFYNVHRHCYECQLAYELELKKKGQLQDKIKEVANSDIDGMIQNYEDWVDDLINNADTSFVTEAGDVESWGKLNKEQLLKQKEEAIEYLKKLKK